eukprot:scaffold31_cov263-Pinguiococcus_pyrenoidosus.AAC.15
MISAFLRFVGANGISAKLVLDHAYFTTPLILPGVHSYTWLLLSPVFPVVFVRSCRMYSGGTDFSPNKKVRSWGSCLCEATNSKPGCTQVAESQPGSRRNLSDESHLPLIALAQSDARSSCDVVAVS